MKLKSILPSIAIAAALISAGGSAHAVSVEATYTLPTAPFKILTGPSATATYYELIAPTGAGTNFLLEGAYFGFGSTATYEIFKDDNSAVGAADISTPALGTFTGVADDNPDYFFSFIFNPGQYVLSILNSDPGNTTVTAVSSVPLPGAMWLFASALLGFFGFSSRRKA